MTSNVHLLHAMMGVIYAETHELSRLSKVAIKPNTHFDEKKDLTSPPPHTLKTYILYIYIYISLPDHPSTSPIQIPRKLIHVPNPSLPSFLYPSFVSLHLFIPSFIPFFHSFFPFFLPPPNFSTPTLSYPISKKLSHTTTD